MNGVDWEHVAEAIGDAVLSQRNAIESHPRLLLVHWLNVHLWRENPSLGREAVSFQRDIMNRFAPSRRQTSNLAVIYAVAQE